MVGPESDVPEEKMGMNRYSLWISDFVKASAKNMLEYKFKYGVWRKEHGD